MPRRADLCITHYRFVSFFLQRVLQLLQSAALGGLDAQFNLFLPANASNEGKVPLLTYLSGLTCTEDNACVWRVLSA